MGHLVSQFQYRGDRLNHRNKPASPKSFPNYLSTDDDYIEKENNQKDSSFFIAEDLSNNSSAIPFIQQKQETFQERREKETIHAKDTFIDNRHQLSIDKKRGRSSLYKSSRPFKAKEIPSIWKVKSKNERPSINYNHIKQELYVPTEELILLDKPQSSLVE